MGYETGRKQLNIAELGTKHRFQLTSKQLLLVFRSGDRQIRRLDSKLCYLIRNVKRSNYTQHPVNPLPPLYQPFRSTEFSDQHQTLSTQFNESMQKSREEWGHRSF